MNINKKVTVAMSGGVDSGVAALLTKQAGYDVCGATMKLYAPENTLQCERVMQDIHDAKQICSSLGIDHTVYELGDEFNKKVIEYFIQTYISGDTPNPCIVCNKYMKFGALLDLALADGSDMIATGHYAVIERSSSGRYLLRRASDTRKDQTYVLWSLDQRQLSHTLFPLGKLTKTEIREIAELNGLVNAYRSDSQDICFIPDGDYVSFIERTSGYKPVAGDYLDIHGNIIGRHKGMINYTVGQRKGLGISMGKHIFVKEKNALDNTVTLSDEEFIFSDRIVLKNINLIPFDRLESPMRVQAKIRYSQTAAHATCEQTGDDELTLIFDTPQRAAARGQSAVIYDGDYIVGGGIISKT